jgi:hypothetical protein
MADPAASQVQSRLAQLADVDSGAPVTLLTAAPA